MNIVSFARAVPFVGVPHAGGAYLHSHLAVLSEVHRVSLVVPGTHRNNADHNKMDLPLDLVVIPPPSTFWGRLRSKVTQELFPSLSPAYVHEALRNSAELRAVVADADIIEFQWSEYSSLSRLVKRLNPSAVLVCVMHDVLRQKYRRRLISSRSPKERMRALLGFVSSTLFESANLLNADRILVFSDKDRELLGKRLQSRILIVNPPLEATADAEARDSARVLFTGALSRPENDEGVRWFISNCWDAVCAAVPDATLIIAGAGPTDALREIVAFRSDDIVLTGYLENLDSVYPGASVFVNPVKTGAGVKFKTITAMLYSLPIVSTHVGAEGIGTDALYVSITDDPVEFSKAVVQALQSSSTATAIGEAARLWATQEYGTDRFRKTLNTVYSVKKDVNYRV